MSDAVCIEGIDPGSMGAVAFLWATYGWLKVVSLPTFKVTKSRTFTYVDAESLVDLIEEHRAVHGYLERVHSHPHDGPVGAFTFGDNFGSIKGCHARRVPLTEVEPGLWKTRMGVVANKKESIARAKWLMPDCSQLFTRSDLAEAAMIALYGAFDMNIPVNRRIKPYTEGCL